MTQITEEQVNTIAQLAELNVDTKSIQEYMQSCSDIADSLNEVDTENVEPMIRGIELENVFRDDIVTGDVNRDAMLSNTTSRAGCYVVPRTIDGGVE